MLFYGVPLLLFEFFGSNFMSIPSVDITAFLAEDIGTGDITAAIIPASLTATAEVVTREDMVLCGQAWFNAVFTALDADVSINWQADEGTQVASNTVLCQLSGLARGLLTGERTDNVAKFNHEKLPTFGVGSFS